jgi:hypothetical protein
MMGIEMVPEMSVIFNQLMWLMAQKDLINLAAMKASDLTRGPLFSLYFC